jgi:Ran GTPase-activating protein (RanGAP) involved in mRNA processing and transport
MEDPDEPVVDMQEIEAAIESRRVLLEQECVATKIDLTASGLDDLDALTIALALFQKTTPLHALLLGSNSITDEGLDSIAGSLAAHPELKELYLGSNLFRDPGVLSLSRVLPDLSFLHTLSLSSAHIEDSAATELSSALMSVEFSSLKRLYLNQNCISDDGLLSLV